MNRATLQQQRDWLQQRVNAGGRSFSPWDALELLDALLGEEDATKPGPKPDDAQEQETCTNVKAFTSAALRENL